MDKTIKQTSWEPGTEIESEAHYQELSENLANKLVNECTTKELAVGLAQHMIYLDALEGEREAHGKVMDAMDKVIDAKDDSILHLTQREEYLRKNTAGIAKIAVEAWRKKTSIKRTSGFLRLNEAKEAARSRAQSIAADRWKEDTEEEIRLSDMAQIVWKILIDEGYKNALPDSTKAINEWIKSVAPAYARKPGRPQKCDGHNH